MKEIVLIRGKFAIVDDDDYDRLMAIGKWSVQSKGYAYKKGVLMHRLLTNAPKGSQVDHINGDKLDNRKINLRVCTHSQNQINRGKQKNNTSGFKGVYPQKQSKKYRAKISVNGKEYHLGYFDCPIEAAKAYNAATLNYHEEFAKLNIIPDA